MSRRKGCGHPEIVSLWGGGGSGTGVVTKERGVVLKEPRETGTVWGKHRRRGRSSLSSLGRSPRTETLCLRPFLGNGTF